MAFRYLIIRPPPELRRRVSIAAAHAEVPSPLFCRRLLATWLQGPHLLEEAPSLIGPYKESRVPVSSDEHRALRVFAAEQELSVNELVLRVLHQACPREVELLAAAIEGERSPYA